MKNVIIRVFFLVFVCVFSVVGQASFKSLNYLYSIAGVYTVSGQHNDQKPYNDSVTGADFWTNEVYEMTGKYPGLYGGDLLFHGSSAKRWEMVYEAERQWKEGAMVSVMWHACPPTQVEPCAWDGGVRSRLSAVQWLDLLADGGALNMAWKRHIDTVAAPYLRYLEGKGVEVFWRPFHEQNEPHFWWNSGTPENTAALWRLTHDYMTSTLGLGRLIWAWDVQDIVSTFSSFNPGAHYFDIAALDVYNHGFYDRQFYTDLLTQADGKPVVFGKSCNVPSAKVLASMPQMSFFMIWSYGLYGCDNGESSNMAQEVMDVYNSSRVITRDEMPGWDAAAFSKSRCIVDFEGVPYRQGAWNGSAAVVANPLVTGANASANVCRYTVPSNRAWRNCAWVLFDEAVSYGALDSMQIMVKGPSATQLHVELENSGAEDVSPIVTNYMLVESDGWQCVTLHFPAPSDNGDLWDVYDKLAIFFNVNDDVGGEVWYYDSVMVYEQSRNVMPIAHAGEDREAKVDDVVVLDASASSDADGDALSFTWVSHQYIDINDAGSERASFTVPMLSEGDDLVFILVVNDGLVDSYADTVVISSSWFTTGCEWFADASSVYSTPMDGCLTVSSPRCLSAIEVYPMSGDSVANANVGFSAP